MAALTNFLTWTGIGIGGLLVLVILSFVLYLVWTSLTGGFSPKGLELEVTSPPLLGVDQEFVIAVTLRNLFDAERQVHSIDFDKSLLKGFVIRQIEPTSKNDSSGLGTTAHYFDNLRISPRGHVHVKFSCHSVIAGDYSGNLCAYVDYKHTKSLDKTVRLVIR